MNNSTFYYGSMKAGKSLHLIYKFNRNYFKNPYVITYKNSRYGDNIVKSRAGFSIDANDYFDANKIDLPNEQSTIFIDEAQFLSKNQIMKVMENVYKYNSYVYFFGLRTNFEGELFEGSQYLLAWCDRIKEISNKCLCGRNATMNYKVCGSDNNITASYDSKCFGCFNGINVL